MKRLDQQINAETLKPHAPNLPGDILTDIFLQFPVKPLLKCRCVCKSWRDFIDSKPFIKLHLEKSTNDTNFTYHRVTSIGNPPARLLKDFSLQSLLNERVYFVNNFLLPRRYRGYRSSAGIVGCCNGLVCISLNKTLFVLFNPTTRRCHVLPELLCDDNDDDQVFMKCDDDDRLVKGYGFGYDECNDDYKVLATLSIPTKNDELKGMGKCFCLPIKKSKKRYSIGKIFSLKTNTWKTIDDFGDSYRLIWRAKFVNGKLHWLGTSDLTCEWYIVSFDLKDEVCGIVEQRVNAEPGFKPRSVEVLNGCLSLLCHYERNRLDIWILKGYGVKDSWNKVASVSYLTHPARELWEIQPLWILPNGKLILCVSDFLILYDPVDHSYRCPKIVYFHSSGAPCVYVESLVSPNVIRSEEGRTRNRGMSIIRLN